MITIKQDTDKADTDNQGHSLFNIVPILEHIYLDIEALKIFWETLACIE